MRIALQRIAEGGPRSLDTMKRSSVVGHASRVTTFRSSIAPSQGAKWRLLTCYVAAFRRGAGLTGRTPWAGGLLGAIANTDGNYSVAFQYARS